MTTIAPLIQIMGSLQRKLVDMHFGPEYARTRYMIPRDARLGGLVESSGLRVY